MTRRDVLKTLAACLATPGRLYAGAATRLTARPLVLNKAYRGATVVLDRPFRNVLFLDCTILPPKGHAPLVTGCMFDGCGFPGEFDSGVFVGNTFWLRPGSHDSRYRVPPFRVRDDATHFRFERNTLHFAGLHRVPALPVMSPRVG